MYIALSDKITTLLEAIKCVAHECKHIEQLIRAKEPTTEQEERLVHFRIKRSESLHTAGYQQSRRSSLILLRVRLIIIQNT
jgi:hypothetical protein